MAASLKRLQSRLGRDLFLPLGFRLSLALEQVTWAEVTEDPGLAAFAIRSGKELLAADGVINWFDTWFEAEGAGVAVVRGELGEVGSAGRLTGSLPDAVSVVSSEPVGQVLEVTRRLASESADQSAVLGYLTGGASLLAHLFGDESAQALMSSIETGRPPKADAELMDAVGQISVKIADAYCSAGVSALLLAEEIPVRSAACLKPFEPLLNLAAYYNVPVILVARIGIDAVVADEIRRIGVSCVGSTEAPDGRVIGIPIDVLPDEIMMRGWLSRVSGSPGSRTFLTGWDLPATAGAETVTALSKAIQECAA